jgi:hypothetical protein
MLQSTDAATVGVDLDGSPRYCNSRSVMECMIRHGGEETEVFAKVVQPCRITSVSSFHTHK